MTEPPSTPLVTAMGLWQGAISHFQGRRSSGVEHVLGKDGVHSSILCGGTILFRYPVPCLVSYQLPRRASRMPARVTIAPNPCHGLKGSARMIHASAVAATGCASRLTDENAAGRWARA